MTSALERSGDRDRPPRLSHITPGGCAVRLELAVRMVVERPGATGYRVMADGYVPPFDGHEPDAFYSRHGMSVELAFDFQHAPGTAPPGIAHEGSAFDVEIFPGHLPVAPEQPITPSPPKPRWQR